MEELRIDALARKARTTTRNVRAYASRGLLPPPRLEGRTAFYGEAHLARLRLIDRLAARGFSLASMKELIEAWEQKQDLQQLLGLEAAVTTPTAGGNRVVSLAELKRLAPELAKNPKLLARAVKLELLAKEGARYRILNERALRVGRALADAGIAPAAAIESLAPLKVAMEPIAQLFVALFKEQLWTPYLAAGAPAHKLQDITAQLDRLRPVASEAVGAVLDQVLDRAISDTAARELALFGIQEDRR